MGKLGPNMSAGVHACAERTCHSEMSQQKPQIEIGTREANDVMPGSAEDFGDLRKVSELSFSIRRRWLTFGACQGLEADATCGGEADGKVSIERLCITLLMSKNLLTQKVIKSFVPELRSRKCFLCFGIPMSSICEL